MTSVGEAVLFWIVAPLMVISALGLIFSKRAVYAALSMAFTMILMGVLFLAQRADFLGMVQVFVYTGAVMMLFIFVIMIVGVDASETLTETLRGHRWIALGLGIALAVLICGPIAGTALPMAEPTGDLGGVTTLAFELFGTHLLAFEMVGVLLTIAGVAALTLSHRERLVPKRHQRDLMAQRVKDNHYVAGLPAPGVYARHNAADTPALLPDGTPSELSVSRVLRARRQTNTPDGFVEAAKTTGNEIEEGSER
ncbi:NADH-quinone oxidoreductase subunit J [Dermatophilus congolensis]|uniref:NADH-quinone oxidoreductase subunit J n=1 Tax=Dermatophilus congolensis TaxID=1863 RepID=A0A239VR91_9MICO|nr:NADH-quinone oxidoreductase subunit J [Dermatophilus congolensis]MBO3129824.1 NADH-quinone oxidoreductase subunit J [Dermatophilus congolensis]MBO3131549.1 NADH-quinone oxidoreductase subunit J [Dermatophilus congolensis]MBO3134298.1 NADH-quinone oxidoreductase subunit J [Dermatophilus congolensis]MBO3136532.1 NADH-quinone oxidoreductase subunit J [Dermatophilus congolensis]MBO3138777.1 NADH-quinone oxidoreductase subunit J [Dermatophilus congolensis]